MSSIPVSNLPNYKPTRRAPFTMLTEPIRGDLRVATIDGVSVLFVENEHDAVILVVENMEAIAKTGFSVDTILSQMLGKPVILGRNLLKPTALLETKNRPGAT